MKEGTIGENIPYYPLLDDGNPLYGVGAFGRSAEVGLAVREGRTKEGRESLTGREKVGSRLSDGRHERTAIPFWE